MNAEPISPSALLCSQLPERLRPPISPEALHRARGLSAHTRLELIHALVEQLAIQQPELLTALLQSCQPGPSQADGSRHADFVTAFVYQLLPPDVFKGVAPFLGSKPEEWSQRARLPFLEDLERWLGQAISEQPGAMSKLIVLTVNSGDPSALQSLALSLPLHYQEVSRLDLDPKVRTPLEEAFESHWPLLVQGETELRWTAVVETLIGLAKCDPAAFAANLLRLPKAMNESESWSVLFPAEKSGPAYDPPLQTWLRRALPAQAEILWQELGNRRKLRNKLQQLTLRYDLDTQPFLLNFERYLSLQRMLDSATVDQDSAQSVEAWFERRRTWPKNSPLAFLRLLVRFLQVEIKEIRTRDLRTRLRYISVALQLGDSEASPLAQALQQYYPGLCAWATREDDLTSFERIRSLEVLKRFFEAHSWKSTVVLHQRLGSQFVSALTCQELIPSWLEFIQDSPRWR